jgi:nucleoside-diphosphate-sugar epimerase
MTTVLLSGPTGTLGARIAHHLLAEPDVHLRVLVRDPRPADPEKRQALTELLDRGARIALGDLTDGASLHSATEGVDVIVSAVQGGGQTIVDGQLALARAGQRNGVERFVPSDFALDLFVAPAGAPTLALRRELAAELDAAGIRTLHVLNGGFMDLMLARRTGMIDLDQPQAAYWGTGDEPFDLTTVDDTARFTAHLAADPTADGGVHRITGARTSINAIADAIEERTGRPVPRHSLGTLDQLRHELDDAGDPWAHVMEWYSLALFSTPPFAATDNARYPGDRLTTLEDYLDDALAVAPVSR